MIALPSLFILTGGDCAISSSQQALKANMAKIDRVGAFSDDIRDGIKGSVFDAQWSEAVSFPHPEALE